MHGAGLITPKSPRIHLRTARARQLPYPATYQQRFRRNRSFFIVLGLACLCWLLLYRRSSSNHVFHDLSAHEDVLEYNSGPTLVPAAPVPKTLAEKFNLQDLPVRVPVHSNPRPPLARESVFTNPWPGQAKIATFWLSDERLNNIEPGFPNWPTELDRDQSRRRNTLKKVAWNSLFRPRGYKGPVALVEKDDGGIVDWPRIQSTNIQESEDDVAIRRARQDWVMRAFLHAWRGYKSKAWGHDEVKPLTGKGSNGFNGWGATIVDSLSTLLLLNLTDEYSLARTHIRQIDFTMVLGEKSVYGQLKDSRTVPVFETIIRYLGGLLSAYDLSGGDSLMLERAEDLAEWLMGAFELVSA
jgi:mannosyl-oligosaccharide alpha-1,2-mannosidase